MIGLKYYTINRNIYIHGKTYTAVCPIYHKTNVVHMCKRHSLYIFVKKYNISQSKQDKRVTAWWRITPFIQSSLRQTTLLLLNVFSMNWLYHKEASDWSVCYIHLMYISRFITVYCVVTLSGLKKLLLFVPLGLRVKLTLAACEFP